jgi:hypothetical protein
VLDNECINHMIGENKIFTSFEKGEITPWMGEITVQHDHPVTNQMGDKYPRGGYLTKMKMEVIRQVKVITTLSSKS